MKEFGMISYTRHASDTANINGSRRSRREPRSRDYIALQCPSTPPPLGRSTPSTPSTPSSSPALSSSTSTVFSTLLGKRKSSWSVLFILLLIASQASLSAAKKDKRRTTVAPTFQPTVSPTFLPTSGPTAMPTERKNANKNNRNNNKNNNNRDRDRDRDDKDNKDNDMDNDRDNVAPPPAPTASPILFSLQAPTPAPVPRPTRAPVRAPTPRPIAAPTVRPTWWARPTESPVMQSRPGSTSVESRNLAIPHITVVFEFSPEIVVSLDTSTATSTTHEDGGGVHRRHLSAVSRNAVTMEHELISFITMVLKTNTAQGRDSLTAVDLDATVSYDEDNELASGVALVSGTALYTGDPQVLPTEESLHENLVLYFKFWGTDNLREHLVTHDIDVSRVTVLIDGQTMGSSSTNSGDIRGDLPGGQAPDDMTPGSDGVPLSDTSEPSQGNDDGKAGMAAGLSMGFMLLLVMIVVTALFLRHRRQSSAFAEHDLSSCASINGPKKDYLPHRRAPSSPQQTTSTSSHQKTPGSTSSSSGATGHGGIILNMNNHHQLKHEEWDALAEPTSMMMTTDQMSQPVSSIGAPTDVEDNDEQDDDNHDGEDDEESSHTSLFTASVATVTSDMIPPPRGALHSAGGSSFPYDARRLDQVISNAHDFARDMGASPKSF